ncbi:hypothetical protein M758_8G006500 [Ceratodon purpureus]|uniref:Uncharacterized protein n=1 Tax=Ceratodon purpureus TaxID=3225 RepID=A0A8T0GTV2_CERPU|nr:hypothetical protein KC19_8G007200 [Ceratodon purpureus]KAG0607165.1 hypothetical protein M758_8G006500 [Ceratodon purpureus]
MGVNDGVVMEVVELFGVEYIHVDICCCSTLIAEGISWVMHACMHAIAIAIAGTTECIGGSSQFVFQVCLLDSGFRFVCCNRRTYSCGFGACELCSAAGKLRVRSYQRRVFRTGEAGHGLDNMTKGERGAPGISSVTLDCYFFFLNCRQSTVAQCRSHCIAREVVGGSCGVGNLRLRF